MQEQAALWALRLAGEGRGDTRVDWTALSDWLERDPAARTALDAAETALAFLETNRPELRVLPARERPNASVPIVRNRRRWIAAGSGLAAAGLAASALLAIASHPTQTRIWQAPADAVLRVALDDGSQVILDRSARLELLPSRHGRDVRLSSGSQALFDVAHDPAHPFRITVGAARIQVLGTLFDVDDLSAGLEVEVARGTVEVADHAGAPAVRVAAGERLSRTQDGDVALTRVSAGDVGAWRSGELTYVDAPFTAVARDLGRYWGAPVALGRGAATLRFTGVLVIDTPKVMAARLRLLAPITTQRSASGFVLQGRESAP